MFERRPQIVGYLLPFVVAIFVVKIGFGLWSSSLLTDGHQAAPGPAASLDRSVSPVARSAPTDFDPVTPDQIGTSFPNNAPGPGPAKWNPTVEALRQKLEKPDVVPGEALLSFRSAEAMNRFIQLAAPQGLAVLGTIPQLNSLRVRYGTLEQLGSILASAGVDPASVEGNPWLAIPSQPPPQPEANNQYGTAPFGANTMGAIGAGGDRTDWGDHVTVAVLDTGVLDHPTFGQGQVTHLDLVNDGQPFDSHGTSVASLVGGRNPQAPGVAPAAQILDVRVANSDGMTVGSVLAEGIVEATDRGAQVINMSLGGYGDSPVLAQSIAYALQHGVVVVAAAGNDAADELAFPAAYQGVLSVAAVDANDKQAFFSNSGQGLDLAAPGVGVTTAWSTNQLASVSGTSQAAALTSGAVAAYLAWGVAPNAIIGRLQTDALPTGASAVQVGAGVLMIRPPATR
jgi:thermitase